jgi:hypothetical protein
VKIHLSRTLENISWGPICQKNLEGLSIKDFEEIKDGQFPQGGH